eukprot:TRINITY_DN4094_c0_g1_i1.p2 TRINITY_DN4094_c0_g1~~TRINITY_DN4094_c0_g1_i1.p2  ORF type:complete len:195 (-),score=40.21 TRINITY_DN4094_c0_g1_i1:1489-2040(-)
MNTLTVAIVLLVCAVSVCADATIYNVDVASKTEFDPFFGIGFSENFVLNDEAAPKLKLRCHETYEFHVANSCRHPFFLTKSVDGGGGSESYTKGVSSTSAQFDDAACDSTVLTFTVPDSAPRKLFYQCNIHQSMGNKIKIKGCCKSFRKKLNADEELSNNRKKKKCEKEGCKWKKNTKFCEMP